MAYNEDRYLTAQQRAELSKEGGAFTLALAGAFWMAGAWFVVRLTFGLFSQVAPRMAEATASIWWPLGAGVVAIALGAALYALRESKRRVYASLELGTAAGMAMELTTRATGGTSTTAVVLGYFGAIYVAVRAFDNFAKARVERAADETRKTS